MNIIDFTPVREKKHRMKLLPDEKLEVEVLSETKDKLTCKVWLDYGDYKEEYVTDFPKSDSVLCTLAENGKTILIIPRWLSVAKLNAIGLGKSPVNFSI